MCSLTLKTSGLVLRELRDGDVDNLCRIVGQFEVSKWLAPVPHPYMSEDADDFVRRVQEDADGLIRVIETDSRFVGLIGIEPGFGYWLCPTVWGRGLMTEAAQAVIDDYFARSRMDEVTSYYFEGNVGSQRVLEKVCFEDVGPNTSHSLARAADVASRRMRPTHKRWTALREVAV